MKSCNSRRSHPAGELQGYHRTILKELQKIWQVPHVLTGSHTSGLRAPSATGMQRCPVQERLSAELAGNPVPSAVTGDLVQGSLALLPLRALPQCQHSDQGGRTPQTGPPGQAAPLETTIPGKVWGAGDNVLELGKVDGTILVDVRLLQDLEGRERRVVSCVARTLQQPVPCLTVLTFRMSCSISVLLSRDSSPCPVRQFTSFSRSFLSRVPSSSKSVGRGKLCFGRAALTPESHKHPCSERRGPG